MLSIYKLNAYIFSLVLMRLIENNVNKIVY